MVGCSEGRLRQRQGQRRLRQDACCMLDKSDAYSHSVPQSIAPRRFDGLQMNSSITSAVVSAPSWFEQDHAGRLNRLICERPRRSKRIFCLLTRGWVLPPVGPRDTAVSCLGPEGSPRIGAISGLRARRHGESIWFCRSRLINRCAVLAFALSLLRRPQAAALSRQRSQLELCKLRCARARPTRSAPSCWRAR
jgi:hypothetical protein